MKSQDSKALWTTQPEKPGHYSYLKEFRVEQCPLFLQHKCTQHRPYTCFHWHFLNQRRRRPIRKRDGSFNYSPDNYCTKFDENTGICPDGDDCPFLHRTAGDTERRYHLRYYKTGICVHETDVRGYCIKNGPHCAFAHGVDDVRPPVYDLREIHQSIEGGSLTPEGVQQLLQEGSNSALVNGGSSATGGPNGSVMPNNLDKERNMVNDDPRWQDTAYVLANYKTEPCKRPPRLCRQGYACPQHHNSRDRRRPPKKFKYRSTACPNVKHSDEWGEPNNCESGDSCQYCHTRTEQQFHPEIYKSSKCNDIQQTGYCPRGVFCAFAHVDQEMTAVRETAANENCGGTSLADILQCALPPDNPPPPPPPSSSGNNMSSQNNTENKTNNAMPLNSSDSHVTTNGFVSAPVMPQNTIPPIGSKPRHFSGSTNTTSSNTNNNNNNQIMSHSNNVTLPNNILPAKDHLASCSTGSNIFVSSSASSNSFFAGVLNNVSSNSYLKAPGSERENDSNLKKQLALAGKIDDRSSLECSSLDKLKRKPSEGSCGSLFIGTNNGLNNGVLGSTFSAPLGGGGTTVLSSVSSVSPLAPPFYPTSNTVESVVGNALDDLNLSELSAAIDPEYNSISSSLNSGLASSGLIGSAPVNIPGSNGSNSSGAGSFHDRSTLLSNFTNAVSASPSTAFNPHFLHSSGNSIEQNNLAAAFLRVTNGTLTNNTSNATPLLNQHTPQQQGGNPSNHLFDGTSSVFSSNNFPVSNTVTNNLINNMVSAPLSQSPLLQGAQGAFAPTNGGTNTPEMWRLKEELITNRAKLASWEEGIAQARTACEAWKREVDEAHRKIKITEQSREEVLAKLSIVQQELDALRAGKVLSPYVQVLNAHSDLDSLPRHVLQQLSSKLRADIEAVDKAMNTCALATEWSNVPNW